MTDDKLRPGHIDRRDPTTLVFFHIPKTGGQTLSAILRRQYPTDLTFEVNHPNVGEGISRFEGLSKAERARYRAVQGHLHLELANSISNPTSWITMLREPVGRVISHYQYIARRPDHPDYEALEGGGLDVAAAIKGGVFPLADNGQTRSLFGIGQLEVGHGHCTAAMLETAKQNLRERFVVAGLTERFDETLQLVVHNFGWKNLYYTRKNVGPGGSAMAHLTKEAIEVVRSYNELDIQLYEFVREQHHTAVEEMGSAFRRKTRRFARANHTQNRLRQWKDRFSTADLQA